MATNEAKQLKSKITELTGREPKGPSADDVRYLRRRLSVIEARIAEGNPVRVSGHAQRMSFSLHERGCAALEAIVKSEGTSITDVMRRALAEWATHHGYAKEAATIGGLDA